MRLTADQSARAECSADEGAGEWVGGAVRNVKRGVFSRDLICKVRGEMRKGGRERRQNKQKCRARERERECECECEWSAVSAGGAMGQCTVLVAVVAVAVVAGVCVVAGEARMDPLFRARCHATCWRHPDKIQVPQSLEINKYSDINFNYFF